MGVVISSFCIYYRKGMSRRSTKSIYGSLATCQSSTDAVLQTVLTDFVELVNATSATITKLTDSGGGGGRPTLKPVVSEVSVAKTVRSFFVAWTIWSQKNPGILFNKSDITNLIALKDIYLANNYDPSRDPYYPLFANL